MTVCLSCECIDNWWATQNIHSLVSFWAYLKSTLWNMGPFSTLNLMWFIFMYSRALAIFCAKFRVKSETYFEGGDIIRHAETYYY